MRETRHILNHAACTIEMVLEEETGAYTIKFHSPPSRSDPAFLRDLKRWIRGVGRGWQQRTGRSNRNGEQIVAAKFSSQQTKEKFKT
jgi:hypothetical protein